MRQAVSNRPGKVRMAVLCEVHEAQMAEFGTTPAGLATLMADAGYSMHRMNPASHRIEPLGEFHGHGVVVFLARPKVRNAKES